MPYHGHGPEGWSDETRRKQEHFRYFLRVNLRVVQAIIQKSRSCRKRVSNHYLYCDLTAGSGRIEDLEGHVGSPVIFWEEVQEVTPSPIGICFERDTKAAAALRCRIGSMMPQCLGDSGTSIVIPCDHAEHLGDIIAAVKEWCDGAVYGLIYADPNGSALPIDSLQWLAAQPLLQRVDILCYVSAANYKRFRKVWPGRPSLLEDLKKIGKRYLYLRRPYRQHQWAFVFLTNWKKYPEIKKLGFVSSESQQGKAILDELDRTKEERGGQGGLDLW